MTVADQSVGQLDNVDLPITCDGDKQKERAHDTNSDSNKDRLLAGLVDDGRKYALINATASPSFDSLADFLAEERQRGQVVFPPPSLQNIFKEAIDDVANSHARKGWEQFTDEIIETLNREKNGLVFLLWGNPAAKKAMGVDDERHTVIKTSRPSPLGATKTNAPFLGSRCFSRADEALVKQGYSPIVFLLKMIVVDVAVGKRHMLVPARNPESDETFLYATGLNCDGQLGLGDTEPRHELTLVPGIEHVQQLLLVPSSHSLVLSHSGEHLYVLVTPSKWPTR